MNMDVHFAKVKRCQTQWVAIKWVVAGTRTASIGTMPSGIPSSLQLSLLPCPPPSPPKEVPLLIFGSSSCPADIFLPNWCRGRPAALDVTVISTLQSATRSGAANTQGFALQVGEQRRMPVHNEACQADGVSFIPLVAESLGGRSEEAIYTITRLLGQHTGTSANDTTRHLFQHLSISL